MLYCFLATTQFQVSTSVFVIYYYITDQPEVMTGNSYHVFHSCRISSCGGLARAGVSMLAPLLMSLSLGLPECLLSRRFFPQSRQSKRERRCVKEFADLFSKAPQSICSSPGFPDDLLRSVQAEGEMKVGPDRGAGQCVNFTVTHHFHSQPMGWSPHGHS